MKADVSTPSPRQQELEQKRSLVRALMGGTDAMIKAGKKYLSQHPGESDGNYKVRLEGNTLSNFLEQTVSKATNRIMAKPIALSDVPKELEELLEDVDLQGRDLNAFGMDILKKAFEDGVTYILVDKPEAEGVKTVADAKAKGIRPYAVHVQASQLLDPVVAEMVNGVRTLTRVRIKECVQESDGGWGFKDVEQIRVFKRSQNEKGEGVITYQLWQEKENAGTRVKEWVPVTEEIPTAMSRIALVAVYTNRVGFYEGLPPFQSTAELNLDHWRVKSEQRNALTLNCFEMLAATGVDEEWTPEIGPAKVQRSGNEQAKFYYLSPSGSGVTLSADYLKRIEEQIETAQASLRIENAGKVTATAAALDSEEGAAGLKAVAEAFGDSLELMLSFFAEAMGLDADKAGEAKVNEDMGAKRGTDAGLQELTKARLNGDISRKAYLGIMQYRGEIPAEFDFEENESQLNAEGPDPATLTGKGQQQQMVE